SSCLHLAADPPPRRWLVAPLNPRNVLMWTNKRSSRFSAWDGRSGSLRERWIRSSHGEYDLALSLLVSGGRAERSGLSAGAWRVEVEVLLLLRWTRLIGAADGCCRSTGGPKANRARDMEESKNSSRGGREGAPRGALPAESAGESGRRAGPPVPFFSAVEAANADAVAVLDRLYGGGGDEDEEIGGEDPDEEEEEDGLPSFFLELEATGGAVDQKLMDMLDINAQEANILGRYGILYPAESNTLLETVPFSVDERDGELIAARAQLDRLRAARSVGRGVQEEEEEEEEEMVDGRRRKGKGPAVVAAQASDVATVTDRISRRRQELEEQAKEEALRLKDTRVLADVEKIRGCQHTNVRSELVAAKLLGAYVKARTLWVLGARQPALRRDIGRHWDAGCSPVGVLKLCGVSASDVNPAWARAFAADMALLRDAGYTCGHAVCLRGLSVAVEEAPAGKVVMPRRSSNGVAEDGAPSLPFDVLDGMLDRRTAAAASAASSSSSSSVAQGTARQGATPHASEGRGRVVSRDQSTVRAGSSMRFPRTTVQLGAPDRGVDAGLQGVVGALPDNMLGLDRDTWNANHKTALFFRCVPSVVKAYQEQHRDAVVFIMSNQRGDLQNLRDFAPRLDTGGDEGGFVRGLQEVAALCSPGQPEDPGRDTSKDLCVFPPSVELLSRVASALVESTRENSLITSDEVRSFLSDELGIAECHIRKPDDPGFGDRTILNVVKEILLLAKSTHGMRVYVNGSHSMYANEYMNHKAVAERRVSLVRRAIAEDPRAAKNVQARDVLGHEEIARSLKKAWLNDSIMYRSGSAMLCWCATSSARAGTCTGFLVKDLTLDKIPVDTEVPTLAGGLHKVRRDALRTRLEVHTSKWGTRDARGRAPGATRVEAQDRTDRITKCFTTVDTLALPEYLDLGAQLLMLFEACGRLEKSPPECLRTGSFLLSKRVFRRGRDCRCDIEPAVWPPEPPLDVWTNTYGRLQMDASGARIVCDDCGTADDCGTFNPEAIRALLNEPLFPGATDTSAVVRVVKNVLTTAGEFFCRFISNHSIRRFNIASAFRVGGRTAAIDTAGHNDQSMVDVYFRPETRQGEGGFHVTTSFVDRSDARGADQQHSGDALATRSPVEVERLTAASPSPLGLFGGARYSRIPQHIPDAVSKLDVVTGMEEELVQNVRELLGRVAELGGEEDSAVGSPAEAGASLWGVNLIAHQGWATLLLEQASERLDEAGQEEAGELVREMERLVKDVVNKGVALMNGVTRSVHRQLGDEARQDLRDRLARRQEMRTLMGETRTEFRKWTGSERDINRLAAQHMPRLIDSLEEETREAARESERAGSKALEARLRSHARAAGQPLPWGTKDLAAMTRPLCDRRSFLSTDNKFARGKRGWINATARKKSTATGGVVGRRAGHAQLQRDPQSGRSPTGVSRHRVHGSEVDVIECPRCLALFRLNRHATKAITLHLQTAHQMKGASKGADGSRGAIAKVLEGSFRCVCEACGPSGRFLPPKTLAAHLAAAREPTPQQRTRMDSVASLRGVMREATNVLGLLSASAMEGVDAALRDRASLALSDVMSKIPVAAAALGCPLKGEEGAALRPVSLTFALTKDESGAYDVLFACPARCKEFDTAGFRRSRTLTERHIKKGCLPEENPLFDKTWAPRVLRCPLDATCKKLSKPNASADRFVDHLNKCHGGLAAVAEVLLGGEKREGTLALLTDDQVQHARGGEWCRGTRRGKPGSPFHGAEDAFLFAQHVSWGPDGSIVVVDGYTLGPPSSTPAGAGAGAAGAGSTVAPVTA
ncbi:unnamed protein product, partial [Scytosiphon promiscuus]